MKSILVIGMGLFGTQLAERMQELGNDVMVVDENPEIINRLAHKFTDSQIGDCCSETVLRSLGVNNFDICFVTIGEDFQASLEISSMLKELGAKHVVSKASSDRRAKLLKKIGADEVINPEKELAEKLAVRYNANNVFDFIQLTSEYSIYEIPCPAKWEGRSITDVDVRRKYGVNVIAAKSGNRITTPDGTYVFTTDEHLVVIGKASDVFKLGRGRD